jgi:hypothetical protein
VTAAPYRASVDIAAPPEAVYPYLTQLCVPKTLSTLCDQAVFVDRQPV